MLQTADLILFAIKAGLKLGQQGRVAYAEATINRDLVLPLPNFNPEVSVGAADGYFEGGGKTHLEQIPRLKELHEKSMSASRMAENEKDEYLEYYLDLKREDDIKAGIVRGDELGLTNETLLSLVKVRQWAREKCPFPSAYQRVLGTLIETGIDYFQQTPGLIDDKSARGRALKGFLNSVDDFNFVDTNVDVLARNLFVAAIETIGDNPDLLGADKATECLVETVSRGLVRDVERHVAKLKGKDLAKKEQIYDWGQLILRSILGSAGHEVLANPATYLPIEGPGEQALITALGSTILDLVVQDDSIAPEGLLTRKALDKLVKAALVTLSEHPSLLGVDNQGLKKILSQVARELGESVRALGVGMMPEIMRVILEKTALNAELVWPDGFDDPAKHILIVAARELLEELARSPDEGAPWKLHLTKSQVMDVLEVTLDEIVRNPAWIIDLADGESPVLGDTVRSVMNTLRSIPSHRITPETAKRVLEEVIKRVASRREFLKHVAKNGERKNMIGLALETITSATLSDNVDVNARWVLAREGVFEIIVALSLDRLAEVGVSEENIRDLGSLLEESIEELSAGKSWSIERLLYTVEEKLGESK